MFMQMYMFVFPSTCEEQELAKEPSRSSTSVGCSWGSEIGAGLVTICFCLDYLN